MPGICRGVLPGEMPPQLLRDRLILVAACWECAGVVVGLPDLELATFKRRKAYFG